MQIRMRKVPVGIIFKPAIFENDYSGLSEEYADMIVKFMSYFPNGTPFKDEGGQFIGIDAISKKNAQCFNLLIGV